MNYIPEVAKMLGVEIEETFKIRYSDNCESIVDYRFGQNGLEHFTLGEWVKDRSGVIDELLEGRSQIIKKPWKPKQNEKYYYIECLDEGFCRIASKGFCLSNLQDLINWKAGDCFRTLEEAEEEMKTFAAMTLGEYEEQ